MDPVEILFARYARDGDVAALADVFDRTAPQLLRLAMHLCRSADEAEELLQATFLVAMQKARSFDARRPLGAWLAGILHKQERSRWRRRRRAWHAARDPVDETARREEPAASAAADPAAAAARGELLAALTEALDRLDPLHREPLRLRLVEGLSAAEIALRLDRSPGAVRVQVHRGMQRLRRLLPPGFALGGASLTALGATLGAGRGLAAVRAHVLHVAATAVPAASIATLVAGGWAMKKVLFAAALVLAVWLALREFAAPDAIGPRGAGSLAQVDVAGAAATEPDLPDVAARQALAPEDTAAAVRAEPRPGNLLVRATWQDDGTPAAGVEVGVLVRHGYLPPRREATTGPDGTCRFDGLPAARVVVDAELGASREVAIVPAGLASIELAVPRGFPVHGRVVDERGAPVPGAGIWMRRMRGDDVHERIAEADADGRFALRLVHPLAAIGARATGGLASDFVSGMPTPDREIRLELVVRRGGADFAGHVVDADGSAVEGATVAVRQDGYTFARDRDGAFRSSCGNVVTTTDKNGRFVLRGVPAGRVDVGVASRSHGTSEHAFDLVAGAWHEQRIVLAGGGTVRGRITDAAGDPLPGATAVLAERRLRVDADTGYADWNGTYHLPGVPPGERTVVFWAHGFGPAKRTVVVPAGGEVRCDVELVAEPTVAGRVVDGAGRPVACRIDLMPATSAEVGQESGSTDERGAFSIPVPPGVEWTVRLVQAGEGAMPVRALDGRTVASGAQDVEIVLGDAELASAWITGRVVDPAGEPLRLAVLGLSTGPWSPRGGTSDVTDGSFRLGPVPPAEYRLSIWPRSSELPRIELGPFALAARQVLDLDTVRLPAGGRVHLRWARPDGVRVDDLQAELRPADEPAARADHLRDEARAAKGQTIAAGDYLLHAWGEGFSEVRDHPVRVRAGETTVVDLLLEPAERRAVRYPVPPPPGWGKVRHATVTIWRDGRLVHDDELFPQQEADQTRWLCLPLGTYVVRIATDAGALHEGRFLVRELLRRGPAIEVAVR